MSGLESGDDFSSDVAVGDWVIAPKPDFSPRSFRWRERFKSTRETLLHHLCLAFDEARAQAKWVPGDRVGVILASTKGVTEDFVWQDVEASSSGSSSDPLTPLLDEMLVRMSVVPRQRICVSNACASSLAALALAKTWMSIGRVDDVVVLACDAIDSFVLHGFHQLRVLTTERTRPFSAERSGFFLGDGAACLILSNSVGADVSLIDARFDSEGYAVTRPSHSGASLLRACRALDAGSREIDLVIAHGTATRANDEVEDRVFSVLFSSEKREKPWITGTKWLIGHTLGACGLLDVVAAREVLLRQKAFSILTTPVADPAFAGRYLTSDVSGHLTAVPAGHARFENILVTSLGFGGVHGAALVGINADRNGRL